MAGTPGFKIFNSCGEYVGAMKDAEDAARVCAMFGAGASIRRGHSKNRTVWNEGAEVVSAAESWDEAARLIWERIDSWTHPDIKAAREGIRP